MPDARGLTSIKGATLILLCSTLNACDRAFAARPERVVIDLAAGPVAHFSPDQAFGAVMPEALFDADLVADFLTLGGKGSFYLGYGA
jgi:hypothetical protein